MITYITSDLLKYIMTLFFFDIYPGLIFITVVRNTIIGKSFKFGAWTAFGVALSDSISGIVAFLSCLSLVKSNHKIFLYVQCAGLMYLSYLALTMIKKDAGKIKNGEKVVTIKRSIIEGFVFNFTNLSVIIYYVSIMSQYMSTNMTIGNKIFLATMIPLVSFLCFILVSTVFSINKFKPFFLKHIGILNKISSVVLLILVLMQIPDVINDLKAIRSN